jgi:hypothetical protein
VRLETTGQLVLNNQSKIRTSLLHLLGARITCAIDVLKITLNFALGFILARYRLRRAIEAVKNPQDLAEEVPAFGRQVSGLSLFIDKPAAELILQTPPTGLQSASPRSS